MSCQSRAQSTSETCKYLSKTSNGTSTNDNRSDIVDTRAHDDNLYLLMIGALRRYIDDIVVNRT